MNGYKTCWKEIPITIKKDIVDIARSNHIDGFLQHKEYVISSSIKGRYVTENNGRAVFYGDMRSRIHRLPDANGKRIYYAKVKYYNIIEEAISIVDDKEITSVNVRHFIKE